MRPRVRDQKLFASLLGALIALAWISLWIWKHSPYGRFLSHQHRCDDRPPVQLVLGLRLGPEAIGEVANGGHRQRSGLGLDARKADLGGKLRAVFAQTEQRERRPHRASVGVVRVRRPVAPMRAAESPRNQPLDRLWSRARVATSGVASQGARAEDEDRSDDWSRVGTEPTPNLRAEI